MLAVDGDVRVAACRSQPSSSMKRARKSKSLQALADACDVESHGYFPPCRLDKPEGTDDLRLVGLLLFVDDAQPIFLAECDRRSSAKSSSEIPLRSWRLSVSVADLPQRIAVDVLDGPAKLLRVEQRALDLVGVALEPFVGAEAGAGRPPKLAADGLLLRRDQLDRLSDKVVVILLPRQGRRVRRAHSAALRMAN